MTDLAPQILTLIAAYRANRYPQRTAVEIEPAHHLFSDLGFDSLDRVELCLAVEEEFHLPRQINESRVFTVADIIATVRGLAGEPVS